MALTRHIAKRVTPQTSVDGAVVTRTETGRVVLETVFRPHAPQPRAYFFCRGKVENKNGVATIEV